ncbi:MULTISPECIES: hypothetical protein [unclassified Gordonia (in: high G+C Gram-positive bacteria)]|uniref:hypothetical protein n=1 Tax=unclassified Gordonia (in: high G+C Gram-positive bacteria) TaxID=2657482 RepID=UPI001FFF6ECF|nr:MULTISPECIES: hypothetical protein [unclassified Gordonia (in: high G+C Gram-positive bacteria)]UQE73563.1 hypothetical protein MYK68_12465 [Gordonia sp. PP30]
MKFRKFLLVGVVAGAVTLTAACGSDDKSDQPPVPPATTTTSAAATSADNSLDAQLTDPNKKPTVAALNDMLDKALDPSIPAKDKTDLVEGSEVDPSLFNQLVKAKKENPGVTYKIKNPITKDGPKRYSVKVEVKLPDNPPQPLDAAIVFDNGRWKLSKTTVCPLLKMGEVATPLCPENSIAPSASSPHKKPAKTTTKSAG